MKAISNHKQSAKLEKISQDIHADIERYCGKGGKIEHVPFGVGAEQRKKFRHFTINGRDQ